MSQPKKKKVVVTTREKSTPSTSAKGKEKGKGKPKAKARVSTRSKKAAPSGEELIFGKKNYLLMGIGFLIIVIGLALMSGGAMDSPDEWIPEKIYSFRRMVVAPVFILAGLVVEIFAIFRR